MRIFIERTLPADEIAAFYAIYLTAFESLSTVAAARHILTAEEFAAEMTDERIDKYLVRDADGTPVALATLTNNLSAVPWINPEFYANRFPEQYARGAVFCLPFMFTNPKRGHHVAFSLISTRITNRLSESGAICAFDLCAFTKGRGIAKAFSAYGRNSSANVYAVDTQTYYVAEFPHWGTPASPPQQQHHPIDGQP